MRTTIWKKKKKKQWLTVGKIKVVPYYICSISDLYSNDKQ